MTIALRRRAVPRQREETPSTKPVISGGLVFFLTTIALNASNFGFQIFVSRVLGPPTYSALSALLAVLAIAGVPLSALQLSSAAAQARLDGPADATRTLRRVLLVATATALVVLLFHGGIDSYLQLKTVWPLAWVCLWLVFATLSAVPQGLLIGQGRFTMLGVTALMGGGLGRLAAGVITSELGLGVSGGTAATAIGQGITLALLLTATRGGGLARPLLLLSAAEGALSTAALAGVAVLDAIDTVLARHTLDSVQSGYYAAASTAGRIALFAPGAVAVLAFPRFVRAAERGESDRRDLLVALAAVAVIGFAVVVVVLAAPRLVIQLLFGDEYLPARQELVLLAPAGALLGCLALATYYHLARGSGFALAAWVGAAAIAGAEARVPLVGHDLAAGVLIVVVAVSFVSLTWALVPHGPLPTARRRGSGRRATATAAAAVSGAETGAIVGPGLLDESVG